MRFKKGCKVEVFDKKEVPYGVWRCAKILSGNGHTYSVSSECPPGIQNVANLRRVPRKAIRPCPPVVDCMENWTAGDVVEVFDDFSWKIAIVLRVVGSDYYLVRVLGSSREVQVQKSNIRLRQAWQDNEWIVIGRGYSGGVLKFNKMATSTCFPKIGFPLPQADRKLEMHSPNSILEIRHNSSFPESHVIAGGMLKRALPFLSSNVQAHHGNARKRRAVEREGQCKQVTSGYQCWLNKVDVVPYLHESVGETYMHSSHKNLGKGNPNYVVEHLERISESTDSEIDACSVGSCSVISNSQDMLSHTLSTSSDGESFNASGNEEEKCPLPLGEEVAARIHSLELNAYRSTLEALYASGPLSWEQEALLTNLRLSLNISNDEYSLELKNLVSAGTRRTRSLPGLLALQHCNDTCCNLEIVHQNCYC